MFAKESIEVFSNSAKDPQDFGFLDLDPDPQ